MSEEEIEYKRTSAHPITGNKVEIKIVKGEGKRNYPKWLYEEGKKKNKNPNTLFLIRLTDLQNNNVVEIPYSYEDQIKLLNLVFDNVILDNRFKIELEKFKIVLDKLEKKRNENT